MHQCKDGTRCETDVAETDPDVQQHADYSDDNCFHCILAHLFTYSRRNVVESDFRSIDTEIVCHCLVNLLTLFQSQRTCFDDDIVASDNLCHLNIGIFCHAFHNRLYLFVQLFDGVILVERNVDGSTALEVKAEVQCASLCLMHENHAGRNGKQQNAGDREEDLSLFHKWKSLALFLGSVVFRILQSHTVQAVDQQSGNNHGAEHGKNNTKSKCHGESADTSACECIQNGCCNQSRYVSVQDGGSCLLESVADCCMNRLSGTDLLLDTGVDDNVRIDCHTDRQDNTGDTRQSQGQVKCI